MYFLIFLVELLLSLLLSKQGWTEADKDLRGIVEQRNNKTYNSRMKIFYIYSIKAYLWPYYFKENTNNTLRNGSNVKIFWFFK